MRRRESREAEMVINVENSFLNNSLTTIYHHSKQSFHLIWQVPADLPGSSRKLTVKHTLLKCKQFF
jgi:hypothetical protein